ncbi:hypothetical protein [Nocardia sp. NPDC056100]|uniref:hypothetical protein n=1 Tax=Nocardia sp. NPDC056100 TaxID=3345712 RepID=UPI0035D7546B
MPQTAERADRWSAMDHVRVDVDRLGVRANELAATLGTRSPRLKAGRLPRRWFPTGVWVRVLVGHPYIVIGPAFDELSENEQDGELAHAVVHAHLLKNFAFTGSVVAALVTLPFAVAIPSLVRSGYPLWLVGAAAIIAAYLVCFAIQAVWFRRIVFQTDRRLAEVLGLEVMRTILDLSRRVRFERRDLVGVYLGLCVPSEVHRADAISDLNVTEPKLGDGDTHGSIKPHALER